jgi:ribonuclease HI
MKTGVGAGLVFISPLGVKMRYAIQLHFPASNNVAEYEALVNGLHITIKLGIKWLDVRGDSRLIIDQTSLSATSTSRPSTAKKMEARITPRLTQL